MRDHSTGLGAGATLRGRRNPCSGVRGGLFPLLLTIALVIGLAACPSNHHHVLNFPSITNLMPNSGAVGLSITINGMNFGAVQGTSTVTFNSTAAAPTNWSATAIAVPVPAGATTGNVIVTVGGQASNGVLFTVTAAAGPSITNLMPNSGAVGLSITINGMNFGAAQGTSTVTFSGIAAVPTSWSATAITVPVPAGATTGNVIVTVGGHASNAVLFTVNSSNLPGDSVTWHYNNSRTGVNPNETILTPANVKSATFGKKGEFTVDGQIDGQILYLTQVPIPGVGNKNVIYVATENDSVYAIDADSISGSSATVLWKTSVVGPGETAAGTGFACGNINPNGVTATPVIDRARTAIYVVSMSENAANVVFDRIHALDLTTGKELFGGPTTIVASFPSQSGTINFDTTVHHDRAALLEAGNTIYTVWTGFFGDCGNYSAWVIAYSADTLTRTNVLNLTPNQLGGGMWMGGAGPAADANGSVYVITGNGKSFTLGPGGSDFPNSFVRLSTSGALSEADFFAPSNSIQENQADVDFGSSGPVLLPDLMDNGGTVHHLAVGAGKDGFMYVVNRDNMGQYNPAQNTYYQKIQISQGSENFSTALFFNNTIYVCPSSQALEAFPIANALVATSPSSQSTFQFGGGSVSTISANGNTNGIVWALDVDSGIFLAFDAANLANELYDSNQAAAGRDHFAAAGGHFVTPMVANGRVYFGTHTTLVVFGPLP